jgi:hypothetical protein
MTGCRFNYQEVCDSAAHWHHCIIPCCRALSVDISVALRTRAVAKCFLNTELPYTFQKSKKFGKPPKIPLSSCWCTPVTILEGILPVERRWKRIKRHCIVKVSGSGQGYHTDERNQKMSRPRYQTSRHPTSRNELEDVKVSPTFSKYTVQSILRVDTRNSTSILDIQIPLPLYIPFSLTVLSANIYGMAGALARGKESLYGTMNRVRSRMKSRSVNDCFYGYLGTADEYCSGGSK